MLPNLGDERSRRTAVIARDGSETCGLLLYLYHYPSPVYDKTGRIERFVQKPQRVGLLTDDGRIWHFTVPTEISDAAESGS